MNQTTLSTAVSEATQKACNSFVIVNMKVSKPSMTKTLPKAARERIAKMIANSKGDGEIAAPDTQVKLFGNSHNSFNDFVLKPLGQFRNNEIYTRIELDGGRAILTAEFTSEWAKIQKVAADTMTAVVDAIEGRTAGSLGYDAWVQNGISSAIRTYEKVFPNIEQWVRDGLPTKAQFIKNCSIQIGLPRKLDVNALDGVTGIMNDLQVQIEQATQAKFEKARTQAISMVEAHLEKVTDQLGKMPEERRLHDTLITNLKGSAATLRGFVGAYDNDPRLITVCDIIDEKIASVASSEVWKNSPAASEKSRQAATQASKQLAGLKDRDLPKIVATAENLVIGEGGLLADLL